MKGRNTVTSSLLGSLGEEAKSCRFLGIKVAGVEICGVRVEK